MRRIIKEMAKYRFVDIGVNLTDPMFTGHYGGRPKHESDLEDVISRAFDNGMEKMIITGGNLKESKKAIEMSRTDPRLFATVGCHPTRCREFAAEPEKYYSELRELIKENADKVVAVGECGLDYDREKFCTRDVQQPYFEEQCRLAAEVRLPLFLHCRAAHPDFISILDRWLDKMLPAPRIGVVHTFDGTKEYAKALLDRGLLLGLNGCSLKHDTNLEVVKDLPVESLMLETDAPWCEIRPTHAGYSFIKTFYETKKKERWTKGFQVKSRNEPVNIVQVLEVVSGLKGIDAKEFSEQVISNTDKLFFPSS